jgi:hypothetical protein
MSVEQPTSCVFKAGDLVLREGYGDDVFVVTSTWIAGGRISASLSKDGKERGYEPIANLRQASSPTTTDAIMRECNALRDLLVAKNAAYGDSALDPLRVFSDSSPSEQIRVRIDDKLSRLSRGHAIKGESLRDTVRDLAGYLILLLIAEGER